jgi:hypothetical protein
MLLGHDLDGSCDEDGRDDGNDDGDFHGVSKPAGIQ